MFRKLLSNLPFNPSLIGQVSFYAQRVRAEESIRRTGFVLVALAVFVQVFAVISPPEQSIAASNNDIVRGGFSTHTQANNYCRANTQGFSEILSYYQVSCEALARATTQSVRSTDFAKRLHSMGRVPQGPKIARTGKPTGEYSVMVNGTQYFMRNLWAWDSGPYSTYKVLSVKNTRGQTILIMYNCGNIVTIGKYSRPPPPAPPKKPTPPKDVCPNIPGTQTRKEECDVCPNVPGEQTNKNECYPCPEAQEDDSENVCLKMTKSADNTNSTDDTKANGGDLIVYTLTTKNTGNQDVRDFVVEENMSDVLDYADIQDLHGGEIDSQKMVHWPKETIPAGATLSKQITVRVKDPIPQTPVSASDPASFDLIMNNVYFGSTINIELPPSVAKSVELGTQTLVKTGPGTTLVVGFFAAAVVGYFLARVRLIGKELEIVRTDFTSAGGL
jgi:uncharacterized repeat protein (TIGR01451 family)